ncbi:aspartyl asparaginyl beta-hydroxylase [Nannochloropsis gaditana]|uniref:Aspartyl asparaginyl beta-hydroxylase n=1 Tax=Nannochloropsis gaditana TaxID=72520 RepID=W7TMY5_9STRA|nr:aspartyl asparaginyl beta-hydroxylase [Nannochloropsis gaditana]
MICSLDLPRWPAVNLTTCIFLCLISIVTLYDTLRALPSPRASPFQPGRWDWHSYILKGQIQPLFAELCPETSRLLQEFNRQSFLMRDTPFSFSFFSTLHGQSVIAPHTGPSNLRLRCHLPLIVPQGGKTEANEEKKEGMKEGRREGRREGEKGGSEEGRERGNQGEGLQSAAGKDSSQSRPDPVPPGCASSSAEFDSLATLQARLPCGIRIGDQVREWVEGKCLVFDDAYEHEVWNLTEEERVLLLVDFWHPEIALEEREAIQKMFEFAARQGWMQGNGG